MKQLFGIDKEKLLEAAKEYVLDSTIIKALKCVDDALVPIESEKKEERCTKCDGKIHFLENKSFCSHCNLTGKEPRKEEPCIDEFSYRKAQKALTEYRELYYKSEAKLSRYRKALVELYKKLSLFPDKENLTIYNMKEIIRTALAEEAPQEKKCLCSEPPRISHPSCPVHPMEKDQQKPQEKQEKCPGVHLNNQKCAQCDYWKKQQEKTFTASEVGDVLNRILKRYYSEYSELTLKEEVDKIRKELGL